MRPALACAVLLPVALSGCRTVQTVALAPSLDAAVAEARGRAVRIERTHGPSFRNARDLTLSERMLSYMPENTGRRDSLPREQVQALVVYDGSLQTAALSAGFVSAGVLASLAYQLQCSWVRTCVLSYPLLASGIGANYLLNPDRERVVYRAPRP